MMKIALAAALVAGMTTFAVQAKEAPTAAVSRSAQTSKSGKAGTTNSNLPGVSIGRIAAADHDPRGIFSQPAADKAAKPTAKAKVESVAKAANGKGRKSAGRGKAKAAEVDTMTTASIAPARKAAVPTVASAKGGKYGDIIARYASAYGVPVSLAHAVIRVESNYRADARGSAGEVGLMQIKPATARGMGYSGSIKALYNPENNIKYGMKYLGMAHKLGGGSTCGTILKYNAGHGAKRMNPVSAAYCSKVKQHLASN